VRYPNIHSKSHAKNSLHGVASGAKHWLRVRRALVRGKNNTLFVTHRGRAFRGGRTVWYIVNRHARAALGIGCGFDRVATTARRKPWTGHYPHLLRASMAAHMLARGCDLVAIAALLGHGSVTQTAEYLATDFPTLRAAAGLHPRAKRKAIP
jgi:site-specific recombinase XerD